MSLNRARWAKFLFSLLLGVVIANYADARTIIWKFELIAGDKGKGADVSFEEKKTVCVPYEDGFITRWRDGSDPQFSNDSLRDGEHIIPEHLSVADVAPPAPQTCDPHADKQPTTPGRAERCVVFWIKQGPMGAQVCQGVWELHVLTDK